MAVSASALTTLDRFKTAHGISGSTQNDLIEQIIDLTSAWIEGQTFRKLKVRNYNNSTQHSVTAIPAEDYIYLDGSDAVYDEKNGIMEFHLPQYPVQKSTVTGAIAFKLATLTNRDASGDTWNDDELDENEHFLVDYERGVIRCIGFTPISGARNYRVTCTAGYQTGAAQPYVPADLERLCIEMGRKLFDEKMNVQSEKMGTWSITYDTAKEDPFIAPVLARYTRYALC